MLLSLFSFYLENSLFILTEGASKERAFQIGQEIVDEVTAANPKPVKLKFEKVFFFIYLFFVSYVYAHVIIISTCIYPSFNPKIFFILIISPWIH